MVTKCRTQKEQNEQIRKTLKEALECWKELLNNEDTKKEAKNLYKQIIEENREYKFNKQAKLVHLTLSLTQEAIYGGYGLNGGIIYSCISKYNY